MCELMGVKRKSRHDWFLITPRRTHTNDVTKKCEMLHVSDGYFLKLKYEVAIANMEGQSSLNIVGKMQKYN